MDESVELFEAAQRRLVEQGGHARALRSQIRASILGLAIFAVSTLVLLAVLDGLPRNPDHSMKLAYYGPILAVLGMGSVLLLRRKDFRKSPVAMSAWMFVLMALAAIPAGAIDLFLKHSS